MLCSHSALHCRTVRTVLTFELTLQSHIKVTFKSGNHRIALSTNKSVVTLDCHKEQVTFISENSCNLFCVLSVIGFLRGITNQLAATTVKSSIHSFISFHLIKMEPPAVLSGGPDSQLSSLVAQLSQIVERAIEPVTTPLISIENEISQLKKAVSSCLLIDWGDVATVDNSSISTAGAHTPSSSQPVGEVNGLSHTIAHAGHAESAATIQPPSVAINNRKRSKGTTRAANSGGLKEAAAGLKTTPSIYVTNPNVVEVTMPPPSGANSSQKRKYVRRSSYWYARRLEAGLPINFELAPPKKDGYLFNCSRCDKPAARLSRLDKHDLCRECLSQRTRKAVTRAHIEAARGLRTSGYSL